MTTSSTSTTHSNVIRFIDFLGMFFDAGTLKEHRKDLKKWRYFVINDRKYKGRQGTTHLLSLYEETIQLIDETERFLAPNTYFDEIQLTTLEELAKEKASWVCYPNNLSKREYMNPGKVIVDFFKHTTANQYKEQLHEWLRLALSSKASYETLTSKQIIDVYDNLRKLYSAAWLIYNRFNKKLILK